MVSAGLGGRDGLVVVERDPAALVGSGGEAADESATTITRAKMMSREPLMNWTYVVDVMPAVATIVMTMAPTSTTPTQ